MTGLATRLLNTPAEVRAELLRYLPTAQPDEMVATRHGFIDIDGYVKRHNRPALAEARRCARLCEWEMAHRWPANPDGVNRSDDRPPLHASNGEDRVMWQRIYAVGRADRDWLLDEQDPNELTQANVIRRDRRAHMEAQRIDGADITATIRVGDFRDSLANITADVVITDPPYPREYLPLYRDLANWADDVLTPGGLLAVMVGQSYLPELLALLDGPRPYRWMLAYLTPGGQSVQLWQRHVNTFWKPVLIYGTVGDRWIGDVTRSDVNDNDKDHHEWGQSVSGMRDLVRRLSDPGQTIADPFMGAGTTGVAATLEGRHFIGCDLNADHVNTAAQRLGVAA